MHRYSAQGSFLKYEDYHPGNANHYSGVETTLKGDVNISALQNAFATVVSRHSLLTSGISKNDAGYNFTSHPEIASHDPVKIVDAANRYIKHVNINATLYAANEDAFLTQPFDLENGPLWRAMLIKTAADEYQFAIVCHPVIADDRSINILLNEIQTYYNQTVTGQHLDLPLPKPSPTVTEIDDGTRKKFWKEKLENLNIIKPHTPKSYTGVMRFRGQHKQLSLDRELVEKLKSSFPGYTMEEILLTSVYTLMQRYTGETDITLGTTDDNRLKHDRQINACANWLTLRMQCGSDERFSDLLRKTASEREEAVKYQLPIENIHQSILSEGERSALRTTAPFDVLLNYKNYAPSFSLQNVQASAVKQIDMGYNSSALFKLNVNQLKDGSCDGILNYNTDLFDEDTIDRLVGHLQNILRTVASEPDCKIYDIPLLLESEIKLQTEFNHTYSTPAYEGSTADIFHTIATQKENHDLPALVFHPLNAVTQRMTYAELEAYSNQIANYFRETCGLLPGNSIAISITRSMNLPAVILGAIKAGLVFVPLETTPGPLFEYKLKNSKVSMVVTDHHTDAMFKKKNIPSINIDDENISQRIKQTDNTFHNPGLSPDDPVYIMYSSGTSSGIPKASKLTHGGLANLFNALHDQHYPSGLKVLCTALPTFDAFLFDFLAAWSSNGCVHLTSDEERYSIEAVERTIRNEEINFAVFLPDIMSLLPTDLPLQYTISMGAVAREGTFDRWLAANPKLIIINGMGHTETGICLSLQKYFLGEDPELIGAPISNMQEFIVDPVHHTLCPIGVPGELLVAGPGLASEYVDNPELTNKHFVTMKFDAARQKFTPCDKTDPEAVRLYKSGDLCCYQQTNDGKLSIKSIGRTDRKYKLYGVSIDLDGVEAMLSKDQLVTAVTVTPNKNANGLIAYVVRNEKFSQIPPNTAKTLLRSHLKYTPLHPVAYPKHIRFLTELPKTANGKIDYKQLVPPPEHELRRPYRNQNITQVITNMWRSVIATDAIEDSDLNHSFAELGGNSMALCQLEIKINSELPLTSHIGVGKNFLCMDMTINSLVNAITPFLKTNNSFSNPITMNSSALNKYKKYHTTLFTNKSLQKIVNQIDTSSNIKSFTNV